MDDSIRGQSDTRGLLVIHSGLDWSEDVGGPWTVIAMIHIDEVDLQDLDRQLARARKNMGRDDHFVFKHKDAKPRVHREFYDALLRLSTIQAHVYRFNRHSWTQRFAKCRLGDPCICDGIITMMMACPQHFIAGQMLHIDYPRGEQPIVDAVRTTIRKEMRASHFETFADVLPRPDDRGDGAIVQVADMIAGEVREFGGVGGPYLPSLGSRITILQSNKNPAAR